MSEKCTLWDIGVNEAARVEKLNITGSMRRRLLDIGLCEGTIVKCVGVSPLGDPKAYLIRGAVIAIRSYDAITIIVSKVGVNI